MTKEALCDLFHAPPIINFLDRFGCIDGIFREKNPVDRIRNRTDLFSFPLPGLSKAPVKKCLFPVFLSLSEEREASAPDQAPGL